MTGALRSIVAIWALLLLASPAWSFIAAPNYGSQLTAGWNGVGDVVQASASQCVISTQDNPPKDGPGEGKAQKYELTASVVGNPQFALTRTGSGDSVPFTLSYFNGGGKPDAIDTPGASYGPFTGGNLKKCNRQSRFEIFIAEASLRGMPAGQYRATLSVTHTNLTTGESAGGTLELILNITAEAISLTALDNVVLGTWDGVADNLAANEPFCVSGTADLFRVMATGEASGFTISNGVDLIYYEVRFAQGTDASAGVALTHSTPTGSYVLADQCVGDNTAIFIQTLTPLLDVSEGSYIGQLTLTVEPI